MCTAVAINLLQQGVEKRCEEIVVNGDSVTIGAQAIPCPTGTYKDGKLCKPITICSVTQWEQLVPTKNSDRVCLDHTLCDPLTQWQTCTLLPHRQWFLTLLQPSGHW